MTTINKQHEVNIPDVALQESSQNIQAKAMVSLGDAAPSAEELGQISLISGREIDSISRAVNDDFSKMASELHHLPEQDLKMRLRNYDSLQRMTFGRAITKIVLGEAGLYSLVGTDFKSCIQSRQDPNIFPCPLTPDNYPGLWAAIQYSLRMLCTAPLHSDPLLISIFCHRVLVRPGETYSGFLHRDLAPKAGRIGTVIWYPRIDTRNIVGADLFCYNVPQDIPLEELAHQSPDHVFPPSSYHGKVMFFAYPKNYPHGVKPGYNPNSVDENFSSSLNDFLHPKSSFFVKDLFILAISERSPVED